MNPREIEQMKLQLREHSRVIAQLVQPKSRPRLLVNTGTGSGGWLKGTIVSIRTASAEVPEEAPYTGLIIGVVTVLTTSCGREEIIGTNVDVVDHFCVFDLPEEDLVDVKMKASEEIAASLDPEAEEGEFTPCHWSADDRCCANGDQSV